MPTILDEIFAHTRSEVDVRKSRLPLADLRREAEAAPTPPDFIAALGSARDLHDSPALIAEVKLASPSRGALAAGADPVGLARVYAENGAAAVSVLTDEKYFGGRLDHLHRIHAALPGLPLLRKDFVCDPYQVYEARQAGASAVLLIAAHLDPGLLADLHALILAQGMAPLVEVHDRDEMQAALGLPGLRLLGVNNRDLRTFRVDLGTCLQLRPLVPPVICFVAESGIHSAEDVARLGAAGVDAVLVGEALVTASDIPAKVRDLSGQLAPGRRAADKE
jgi:indole-3-glycerol phosphate synthase